MSDLTIEQKCKIAATLVEQTPPGEINDVINDIRGIIANDEALMPHVLPALRAYNLSQLHIVEHPEIEDIPAHISLLSEATILPGSETERYVDTVGQKSFAFDHLTFTVSDYEAYNLPEEEETFRSELAKSLSAYAKNHFPSGYSSVSCSQYPLVTVSSTPAVAPVPEDEPEVAAPVSTEEQPKTEAEKDTAIVDPEAELTEEPTGEMVTDVVAEQVNGGDLEPAPTPAMNGAEVQHGEIVEPEVLEKVDEAVEEEKVKEEQEEAGESVELKVEEDVTPVPETAIEDTEAEEKLASLSVEEPKQENIDNPVYTLEVVGNRYNPNNFWTGRWRTRWVVDQAAGIVNGQIHVDVHYYEQGNVQLATNHTASFPCPTAPNGSQSVASQIVTTISKIETSYHLELNDVYGELGDKAFRALRRALPVTRQKMDWDKVTAYSLGADLSNARA